MHKSCRSQGGKLWRKTKEKHTKEYCKHVCCLQTRLWYRQGRALQSRHLIFSYPPDFAYTLYGSNENHFTALDHLLRLRYLRVQWASRNWSHRTLQSRSVHHSPRVLPPQSVRKRLCRPLQRWSPTLQGSATDSLCLWFTWLPSNIRLHQSFSAAVFQ